MISAENFHTKAQADALLKGFSSLIQTLTKAFPMLTHDMEHVVQDVNQDLQNAAQGYENAVLAGQGAATQALKAAGDKVVLPKLLTENESGKEVIWRGLSPLVSDISYTQLGGAGFDLLLQEGDVNEAFEKARTLSDDSYKANGTYVHTLEDGRKMMVFILRTMVGELPALITFRSVEGTETLAAIAELWIPSENRWVRDMGLGYIPAKTVELRVEEALRAKGWKKPAANAVTEATQQAFQEAKGHEAELTDGNALVLAEFDDLELSVRSAQAHEQEGARYANLTIRFEEQTLTYYFRWHEGEFDLLETEGLERPLPAETVRYIESRLAGLKLLANAPSDAAI